jgi:allophanate hydrolase subunit 1
MRSVSYRDYRINPDNLTTELRQLRKDVKLLQENIVLLQEQLHQSYKTIHRLTEIQVVYKEN